MSGDQQDHTRIQSIRESLSAEDRAWLCTTLADALTVLQLLQDQFGQSREAVEVRLSRLQKVFDLLGKP
jgi:hypothetical protein